MALVPVNFVHGFGQMVVVTNPASPLNVKRGMCHEVSDTVNIIVNDLVIPALITPDMDGRNDYFALNGKSNSGFIVIRR